MNSSVIRKRSRRNYEAGSVDACVRAAIDLLFTIKENRARPTLEEVIHVLVAAKGSAFNRSQVSRVLREEFPQPQKPRRTSKAAPCGGWRWNASLHSSPGIYALRQGGEIVYIGSSSNISTRLYSHLILRGLLEQGTVEIGVRYIHKPGEHLAAEYRLIRRLRPRLNVSGVVK